MKNFIQPGDSIDVALPADKVSGDGVMIGSLFGVLVAGGLSGETRAINTKGVFELPKLTANVMTVGAKVNWNNTTFEFQLATSTLDNAATVVEAADGTKSVVKVKLTPV